MKYKHFCKVAVAAATLSLLGGCAAYDSVVEYIFTDSAEKCPDAAVMADAAILPAFDPAQEKDPTTLVYTAKLATPKLTCDFRKKANRATSSVTASIVASRPAGGAKAVYRVPYFIALTTNGRVLDKQIYWQDISFAEGASRASADISVDDIVLRPSRGKRTINYHYVLGFQLTKAQLDYARTMGQYEP